MTTTRATVQHRLDYELNMCLRLQTPDLSGGLSSAWTVTQFEQHVNYFFFKLQI